MTMVGNRPEWVYAMVAAWRIGAVAQPCTEQLRPADLRARMEAVRPRVVVADERDADTVAASGFERDGARGARRAPVHGPARPGGGPLARRSRARGLHVGHLGRGQAHPPRARLSGGPGRAGRALVRGPAGGPVLVHGRERVVQVRPQRVRGPLAARRRRTAPRRPLRPRGAARRAGARASGRALHGAHRVPGHRQAGAPAPPPLPAPRRGRRRAAEPGGGERVGAHRGRGGARRLRPDRDRGPHRHADRPARARGVHGQGAARLPALDRRGRAVRRPGQRAHLLPATARATGRGAPATACARTRTAISGSRGAPTT